MEYIANFLIIIKLSTLHLSIFTTCKPIFMKTCFKALPIVLLFGQIAAAVNAQKLPTVQTTGIRAPANINIDGMPTEWNDKYQAYNSANHLFYTLSNDDKNLYLVVHTTDVIVIRKIIRWGLALTIGAPGKKDMKDPNNLSLSFPIENEAKNPLVMNDDDASDNKGTARNDKMAALFKQIKVTGLPGVNEPAISIYNTEGIKAVASFDDKLAYTYELAIPLKYVNAANTGTLNYNIKLNGGITVVDNSPNAIVIAYKPGSSHDYLFSVTDFGGEYTLAKK